MSGGLLHILQVMEAYSWQIDPQSYLMVRSEILNKHITYSDNPTFLKYSIHFKIKKVSVLVVSSYLMDLILFWLMGMQQKSIKY